MPPESQIPSNPISSIPTQKKANIAGMIKGIFVGALIGFLLGVITADISWTVFWIVMAICCVMGALIGVRSYTRDEEKALFVSSDGLSSKQKAMAWVFSIINPIITGAIMYFMWRHTFPNKAKQANHISIIVFLLWIIVGAAIAFNRP